MDPLTYTLCREALVAVRQRHQPLSTSQALRKVNRWGTNVSSKSISDTGLAIRDALLKRIEALCPSNGQPNTLTTGVNRQVRHSGIYATDGQPLSTRAQQKETLRDINSNVRFSSLMLRVCVNPMLINLSYLRNSPAVVNAPLQTYKYYMRQCILQTSHLRTHFVLVDSLWLCSLVSARSNLPLLSSAKVS